MSHLEASKHGHTNILQSAPAELFEKYPNNTVIIDASELKVKVPSALQKHCESYSASKSHTALKCPLGVDPKGEIMFISQLYKVPISDKPVVQRSGFLDILDKRVMVGEKKEIQSWLTRVLIFKMI